MEVWRSVFWLRHWGGNGLDGAKINTSMSNLIISHLPLMLIPGELLKNGKNGLSGTSYLPADLHMVAQEKRFQKYKFVSHILSPNLYHILEV